MERNNPSDLYTIWDWAHLFTLCAEAEGQETDTESPHFIEVSDWLHQYSKEHDLQPPTIDDVTHTIKEAVAFMKKFSENHMDSMYNR